jgi:hypothetical protein
MLQETQLSNLTNFRVSMLLIQEYNMLHFLYVSFDQFGFYNLDGYITAYHISIFRYI